MAVSSFRILDKTVDFEIICKQIFQECTFLSLRLCTKASPEFR